MEAMPALRRTEGANGSQRASDAERSVPQQAQERPGRFRGRSANVGRSLGIEGVRALARALSLSFGV